MDRRDQRHDQLEQFEKSYNIKLPTRCEVCLTCEGKGTHVNPSIDAHGISAEEWANDWDDESRERYLSGGYDVTCVECGGNRVVRVVDLKRMSKWWLDQWNAWLESSAETDAIYEAERRMGA